MDYNKEEYEKFLSYVRSTWGSLFENDWIEEPTIKSILIHLSENNFKVFVSLNENSYYKFEGEGTLDEKELVIAKYNPENYIKAEYGVYDGLLLYMLVKADIIHDLGLEDVEIKINPAWVSYIPVDEYLSKELEAHEESYAETIYCIEHDL